MMIEIQDLEGCLEKMSSLGGPTQKNNNITIKLPLEKINRANFDSNRKNLIRKSFKHFTTWRTLIRNTFVTWISVLTTPFNPPRHSGPNWGNL